MNISISSLEKKHFPVMLDEVIKICDPVKNHKTFLDCTFGGGGYSKALLKFPKSKVIALDRDVSAAERAKELERNNPNRFKFYNEKFSNLEKVLSGNDKIDVVIFDLGLSMFQLQDDKRGFSFKSKSKIDMQMGLSEISAEKVINELDEKKLKMVLKFLGEEAEAGLIAKNIIRARNLNQITTVPELVKIIEKSKKKNYNKKINVCTKTFQALRIFVNKEISELINALIKAAQFLKKDGKIIVISFHSLEDKIIKFFFKHYASNKSNPSRYLPNANNSKSHSLFDAYNNDFLTPTNDEIKINPPSRSAKLRYATRSAEPFFYPESIEKKFEKYLKIEEFYA